MACNPLHISFKCQFVEDVFSFKAGGMTPDVCNGSGFTFNEALLRHLRIKLRLLALEPSGFLPLAETFYFLEVMSFESVQDSSFFGPNTEPTLTNSSAVRRTVDFISMFIFRRASLCGNLSVTLKITKRKVNSTTIFEKFSHLMPAGISQYIYFLRLKLF